MLKSIGLFLVLAAIALSPSTQAQQQESAVVTLLTADKALVGSTPVPAKDIVVHLASKRPAFITVRTCPKISPDVIQAFLKGLQKINALVILDSQSPDAVTCAR